MKKKQTKWLYALLVLAGLFLVGALFWITMNRLRAKIEDSSHVYIQTVRGMGYIWKGNPQ